MKHTQGPWYLKDGAIIAYDEDMTIEVARMGAIRLQDDDEAEANGHLIAAAPEMYAALGALFAECVMSHRYWGENNNQKAANEAIEAAKAALTKAGGRQES